MWSSYTRNQPTPDRISVLWYVMSICRIHSYDDIRLAKQSQLCLSRQTLNQDAIEWLCMGVRLRVNGWFGEYSLLFIYAIYDCLFRSIYNTNVIQSTSAANACCHAYENWVLNNEWMTRSITKGYSALNVHLNCSFVISYSFCNADDNHSSEIWHR